MAGAIPLSKSQTIRVVSRRPFRESDPQDPNVSVVFDDDGQMVAEEISDVPTDDAAAILAIVEQRRMHAETCVDGLDPSAYAVYLTLRDTMKLHQATLETRFAGSPDHLLVAIRVPDSPWYRKTAAAFEAVVAEIVADRVRLCAKSASVMPEHDRDLGRRVLPIEPTLRHAKSSHVVALYSDAVQLPAELMAFCDVVIEVIHIHRTHFDAAIQREFDEPDAAGWPAKIKMSDVDPDLLDAVCGRAVAASAVVDMLGAVLAARAEAKAASKKSEKAAEITSAAKASAKALYVPEILRPTSPTLDQLHGYGAAKIWGQQLVDDLRDYAAGELPWADVDGGALLCGPPGTGKTLFASALAASCQVAFIPTSYAQWQSSGDGHLGNLIKAMRTTFQAAADAAPSILFLDEADAIRRRGGSGDSEGWWSAVNAASLECVDGTSRREGVVLIAACNHPDLIDPAMLRSGRLDRRFEIGMPDERALLGIMKHHLPDADPADLSPAATALAGSASGADVARIAREARRIARREKRLVTAADLLLIATPPDTLSAEDRRLVAIHEAGHALAIMLEGRVPDMLSIVTASGAHGGVRSLPSVGMGRLAQYEAEVVIRLAGRAAEEVVFGEASGGAEQDLQQATAIVAQILGTLGLGGRLLHGEQIDGNGVESRLRDLYSRAVRLMGEHRTMLEQLADLAIERRVLGHAALAQFAHEHGLDGGAR